MSKLLLSLLIALTIATSKNSDELPRCAPCTDENPKYYHVDVQ